MIAIASNRALARLDPATLARLARRTPEPLLRLALAPPLRRTTIAQIFKRMPSQLKPTAAEVSAVTAWRITDERGEVFDSWYLVFEQGGGRTTRAAVEPAPRTTFTLAAHDLIRLTTGAANPMQMFQGGRIKISGDLFFAAQVSSAFTIPA